MKKPSIRLALSIIAGGALFGCTSGNSGIEPHVTSVNPLTTTTLQFAVGTANIAGTPGLNTLVTFRQNDPTKKGVSGTALNTPTITGPSGFVVPVAATSAGNDAGTNHISATPQTPPGTAPTPTTFGTHGGAFSFGFAPDNSNTLGSALFDLYPLPFYAEVNPAITQVNYIGGPPAYQQTQNGLYPPGFVGFTEGFTDFVAPPTPGTYNLSVLIPNAGTLTTTATLTSPALLPAIPAPAFASDGAGGGTITLTVPPGVTETLVNITDTSAATGATLYYTIKTNTVGTQTLVLPDNLGPVAANGTASPTLTAGDTYAVYAAGFDYPDFEAGPPQNTSSKPTIVGANGQADVTTSPVTSGTY